MEPVQPEEFYRMSEPGEVDPDLGGVGGNGPTKPPPPPPPPPTGG